jgi:hypothetical protein
MTSAPRKPGAAPVPPFKPDGSPYEWGIRLPGNVHIGWADSICELVGVLVGQSDYDSMSAQDQAYHRIMHAVRLQVSTQARINLLAQTVLGDWDDLCEWEREVLGGPRHVQPHGFPSDGFYGGRCVWSARVPLVLVRTGYKPYGPHEPVEGVNNNVWWIDPSTNEALLESLLAEPLGLIRVWQLHK